MLNELKSIKELVQALVSDEILKIKGIDIYQVTGINNDLTCNIKQLNSNLSYDNVESVGLGLGHGKGQIKLPDTNDIILVGFIANSEIPIILGSMFNNYMAYPDTKIDVKADEYFINNKLNGAYIYINEDNDIILKTPNGAKIKINEDGSFKLFNKDNYGIEVDSSGNMTLRGVAINHTQTPGTW